jgi:hypothetical protein
MPRPIYESLSNPRCPHCKGIAQKQGYATYPKEGRKRRYHCMQCGRTFF